MEESLIAQPVLKWPGGKRALLPEILPRLPKKIKTYYEPFIGGGAVFFALAAENRFASAYISDVNDDLMNVYIELAVRPERVIQRLKEHADRHSKTYYYAARASELRTSIARAARTIYLNRTCFNGLYRVNKAGCFNVPFGRYKNPTICDEENLLAVSEVLSKEEISIAAEDFEIAVMPARRGDAVYFDPPYWPVSTTSNFTAYAKGGFDQFHQIRLRDVAARLIRQGVHVLLSNSDTPFVRELYKKFKIERVEAPRRINSKGGKRGNVGELLISGRNT